MSIRQEFCKTLRSLVSCLWDWVVLTFPHTKSGNGFAFLVHPRDITDIYRPFPFFRYLPNPFVLWMVRFFPPMTLSRITGVRSVVTGELIDGFLLTVVLTPLHLFREPRRSVRKVRQMAMLAKKKGVRLIGLGALLPSITHYGLAFRTDIGGEKTPPYVTTGHAFTAYTIFLYLKEFLEWKNSNTNDVCIAIVGAAGSTGSLCAKLIAAKFSSERPRISFILVDLPKKQKILDELCERLRTINPEVNVSYTDTLNSLQKADYVVTVTNAPRAIIRPEHIRPGTIIIDDSQPRNTTPELNVTGALVVDVLACVPDLDCHFDFGFENRDPEITFTCLAETAMLAACEHDSDFSIGVIDIPLIIELEAIVARTNIKKAPLHSFTRLMKKEEIDEILKP